MRAAKTTHTVLHIMRQSPTCLRPSINADGQRRISIHSLQIFLGMQLQQLRCCANVVSADYKGRQVPSDTILQRCWDSWHKSCIHGKIVVRPQGQQLAKPFHVQLLRQSGGGSVISACHAVSLPRIHHWPTWPVLGCPAAAFHHHHARSNAALSVCLQDLNRAARAW